MGMIEIGPREDLNKLYNKPGNRKLKYGAVASISIGIILLLVRFIWIYQLSEIETLLLTGFAGLFAIIFVILYGFLVYRVNREYLEYKNSKP